MVMIKLLSYWVIFWFYYVAITNIDLGLRLQTPPSLSLIMAALAYTASCIISRFMHGTTNKRINQNIGYHPMSSYFQIECRFNNPRISFQKIGDRPTGSGSISAFALVKLEPTLPALVSGPGE